MTRNDLKPLIKNALREYGGKATIAQICKYIWDKHQSRITKSKRILYTWQYDVRWAGQSLRTEDQIEIGKFKKGVWSLK